MNRAVCWVGPVWVTLCTLALVGRAPGQDLDAARILYSHGVHAYFDGNASEAEQSFTRAIAVSPDDPRAWYYRGLSRLRLGRDGDARSDFQAGAAAEARQPNRYAAGAALQRVQGRQRLVLEEYRRQAREQFALQREEMSRARYEQITGREADVLRERVAVPLDQLVPPAQAQSLLGARPAAEPGAVPGQTVAPAAASGAAAKDSGNPFGDDVAEPAAPAPAASQPQEPPMDELSGTPAEKGEGSNQPQVAPGDSPGRAAVPSDSASPPARPAETETDPFLGDDNPFGP